VVGQTLVQAEVESPVFPFRLGSFGISGVELSSMRRP
jgi:hypothetical protein